MKRADWRSALVWIACFVLTLAVLGWMTRQESDRQLEQDAEQYALRWAAAVGDTVPDMDALLVAGRITPAARHRLLALRRDNDLVRFWVHDRDGQLVLVSDDVEKAELPAYDQSRDSMGDRATDGNKARIRAQVLAGFVRASLQRGAAPDLPDVYSEVFVPLQLRGKNAAVLRLHIDQSKRAADAAQGLRRIGTVVGALLFILVSAAVYQFVGTTKRRRDAETRLRYLARHDELSGALNRASFHQALMHAGQRRALGGRAFSVQRINLDGFKDVNERFGHEQGDEVLRLTGQRLQACLREGDQLARLGADEFALLLLGPSTFTGVMPMAQSIVQTLAEPLQLGGQTLRCTGSVGIALHGPDGLDVDVLMNKAESALARAKAQGGGGYAFHDEALDRLEQSRRELTRDLRLAIAQRQLSLHYQPLYGRDADLLLGYEALLRWDHPLRGKVSPGEFVPLAEAAGLIDEIGLWALQQACRDAISWPASLGVAVNLSAKQFADDSLVQQVSGALRDSGLAPHRLCLEITESLLMNNSQHVMDTLRRLAGLGLSIAMDDFGTGYSSLAYLWRFPFDKLKIDQVFTRNMVDDPRVRLIVRSIIALAHSLEVRVNAEGVETREQAALLQELGCDELQGFLLGRPGPQRGLTHLGHVEGRQQERPRGEARESLFATIPMDLPPVHEPH